MKYILMYLSIYYYYCVRVRACVRACVCVHILSSQLISTQTNNKHTVRLNPPRKIGKTKKAALMNPVSHRHITPFIIYHPNPLILILRP